MIESNEAERENPQCWVCGDHATHRDTSPPFEYTCDDHAISIDAERIADPLERPTYADNAQYILNEAYEDWSDLDDRHKHLAVQRALFTLKHEVDELER